LTIEEALIVSNDTLAAEANATTSFFGGEAKSDYKVNSNYIIVLVLIFFFIVIATLIANKSQKEENEE